MLMGLLRHTTKDDVKHGRLLRAAAHDGGLAWGHGGAVCGRPCRHGLVAAAWHLVWAHDDGVAQGRRR